MHLQAMRLQATPRSLTCLAATLLAAALVSAAPAAAAQAPVDYPSASATPLPVDRGSAALWQSLQKLHTRASLILIVAHPDDEDGGMLTYHAPAQPADPTLLTLTRPHPHHNALPPHLAAH